jgi:hypothetical protein
MKKRKKKKKKKLICYFKFQIKAKEKKITPENKKCTLKKVIDLYK